MSLAAGSPGGPGEQLRDHPTVRSLLERCTFPRAGTPAVAALSGGPDSTAMTALAVAAGCEVEAVYVDHGLRPDDPDEVCARSTARRLDVALRVERVVVAPGPNLEARLRTARREVLGPDAMTGHTADDQAETLLLALLRGAGATGLSGMRPGPTHPVLAARRAELRHLCTELGLPFADDPSNDDPAFRRNRVRHELLPLLDEIAERDATSLLDRSADLLRDDDDLLDALAADVDPTDARALVAAHRPLARRAIRRWLTRDGYPPDSAAVGRVLAVAQGDAVACEVGGGWSVRRSRQRLALFPPARSGG